MTALPMACIRLFSQAHAAYRRAVVGVAGRLRDRRDWPRGPKAFADPTMKFEKVLARVDVGGGPLGAPGGAWPRPGQACDEAGADRCPRPRRGVSPAGRTTKLDLGTLCTDDAGSVWEISDR